MTAQAAKSAMESDDALMARVAVRDGEALRLLADRHAEIPWRIAYRMLADPTETRAARSTRRNPRILAAGRG